MKKTSSVKEFEAALGMMITQLGILIRSLPIEQQMQALGRVEADLYIMRKHAVQRLAEGESPQAEVCRQVQRVFGDRGVDWLFTPCWALEWKAPAELLNSEEGAQMVLDTLGRIQHGVFF